MEQFLRPLTFIHELLNFESIFCYAMVLAGAIALAIRFYVVRFTAKKSMIRTARTSGKIVAFERRDGGDSEDAYYPIAEYKALDKTFRAKISLGQYDQKLPKYAPDGNLMVSFNPNDPSDADLASEELVKWQSLHMTILLYVGIGLLVIGGLGLSVP
jgi:hypothetical protein